MLFGSTVCDLLMTDEGLDSVQRKTLFLSRFRDKMQVKNNKEGVNYAGISKELISCFIR